MRLRPLRHLLDLDPGFRPMSGFRGRTRHDLLRPCRNRPLRRPQRPDRGHCSAMSSGACCRCCSWAGPHGLRRRPRSWPTASCGRRRSRPPGPAGRTGRQVRQVLTHPATVGWLMLSTVMIVINWGLYVWATTHHHTLEASLGYYINPLLNMAAGLVLFREKYRQMGLGRHRSGRRRRADPGGRPGPAAVDVDRHRAELRGYGVIRKRVAAEAQTGLFVECLLMLPFGAAWLIWASHAGQAVAFDSPSNTGPGRSPAVRPPCCHWPCSPGRRDGCRCRPSASCSSWPRRSSSPSAFFRASP
jgi:hypothetical protein